MLLYFVKSLTSYSNISKDRKGISKLAWQWSPSHRQGAPNKKDWQTNYVCQSFFPQNYLLPHCAPKIVEEFSNEQFYCTSIANFPYLHLCQQLVFFCQYMLVVHTKKKGSAKKRLPDQTGLAAFLPQF
jgi:hypothetical protein